MTGSDSTKLPVVINLNTLPFRTTEYDVTEGRITLDFNQKFGPQVVAGIQAVGFQSLAEADLVVLPNQGHAAMITAALLYGANGSTPNVPVLNPDKGYAMTGTYNAWTQRQQCRHERRFEKREGKEIAGKLLVINYSHKIEELALAAIAKDRGVAVDEIEVRNVPFHLNVEGDLYAQIAEAIDAAEVLNWEDSRIVVNAPIMGLGALGVSFEIHGRRGSFCPTTVIRETKGRGNGFFLEEILNLNQVAEDGRQLAAQAQPVPVPRADLKWILDLAVEALHSEGGAYSPSNEETERYNRLRSLLG